MHSQFLKALDRQMDLFIERSRNRHPKSLDWLFRYRPLSFAPDYLRLGRFGRTPGEARLNQVLSALLPKVWKQVVWSRLSRQSVHFLRGKYILPEGKQWESFFIKELNRRLEECPAVVRGASFTDFFYFFGECLREFSLYFNLPTDIFADQKQKHNAYCRSIYNNIRDEILAHPRGLELASFLSIRANWIDVVEDDLEPFFSGFLEEVNELLDHADPLDTQLQSNPHFHMRRFQQILTEKKHVILYELDNCGEVFFDLLLAELLIKMGHQVILVGKKEPVLNDVTHHDLKNLAHQAGDIPIIHAESSVAGKYLWNVSEDYKKAYRQATLLLVKGQGHFQTMPMGRRILGRFVPYPYRKPVFYMMGVKAQLIKMSLRSVFSSKHCPPDQAMFFYYFDSQLRETFPK